MSKHLRRFPGADTFLTMMLDCIVLLLMAPTLVCAGENTTAISPHLYGAGEVIEHALRREEITYYLFVRLPAEYEASATSYPVVYLLDGGMTFPMFASYLRYLRLSGEIPPLILVGISYGTEDWRQGNARSHDFTLPSPEAEHYGGAGEFDDYLKAVVLPFIDAAYRTNPRRRYLFGQSLGAQFVLYATLHTSSAFAGGIASNPAIHRTLDHFRQTAHVEAADRLFVSFAEHDDPSFAEPAKAWWSYIETHPPETEITRVVLPGQNHFSAAPEAFRQGLIWLLGE